LTQKLLLLPKTKFEGNRVTIKTLGGSSITQRLHVGPQLLHEEFNFRSHQRTSAAVLVDLLPHVHLIFVPLNPQQQQQQQQRHLISLIAISPKFSNSRMFSARAR
jgi:hypothetical protein